MARTGRFRNRTTSFRGTESRYLDDGTLVAQTFPSVRFTSTCNDSHGRPVTPSAFSSLQYEGIMTLNGLTRNSSNGQTYTFESSPFFSGPGENPSNSPLKIPDGWVLDLVAGTNPSRPVFTPPQVIEDMIQLPSLIRETGNAFKLAKRLWTPRQAANHHLAAVFGWKPLIEDLEKLLDLQTYILKRNKELNQLYSGKGLRRRLKFGSDSLTGKQEKTWALYGTGSITVPIHVSVVKEQWATITWKPSAPMPFHPDDESTNRFARRLIYGLTVEGMAHGLWEVIPWSWLIGWFTNIGKLTLANSNTVPATFSGACFMNKVTVTSTPGNPTVKGSDGFAISALGKYTRTTRTRTLGSGVVAPGFNLPYLDGFRLSVLGSLFAQRFTR